MKKIFYVTIILVLIIIIIILGRATYYYYTSNSLTNTTIAKKAEDKKLYSCPMHPQIISDKPGSCPICGMDLVPISGQREKHKEHEKSADKIEGLAQISISDKEAAMLGLTYERVKKREIKKEIITSAIIVPDESRIHDITTKFNGWVEKLYVNETGQYVKKGQPLLNVYSQELLSAQEEYIAVLKAYEKVNNDYNLRSYLDSLKASARQKLRLYGITYKQIEVLEKTKESKKTMTIYSPATGFVLEKMVFEGQKIIENKPLMTVADLSQIWAEADIYQPDLPFIKIGQPIELTLPYWRGKKFFGKVSFIYPFLNPETRTLKVRMEVDNEELILKPQMYADAKFSYSLGEKISVSEEALFMTGTRLYVFLKSGDNHIKPVIVKTGVLGGDGYYEVLSGLDTGDMVVSPANFLIDSESRLKAVFKMATDGDNH